MNLYELIALSGYITNLWRAHTGASAKTYPTFDQVRQYLVEMFGIEFDYTPPAWTAPANERRT